MRIGASVAVLLALASTYALAQQPSRQSSFSATASVRVVAIKRGEVQLSIRLAPVAFDVSAADPNPSFVVPLTTSWNVSPQEVNGIEVIGYFDRSDQALTSPSGESISSHFVFGRIASDMFRPFSETNAVGPASGSLRFFAQDISDANRRGIRSDTLELKLADSVQVPAARYTGVLHLEARYY